MNEPDLAEIQEEWAGFMPTACAGLNRMRKVINALVRRVGALGGGGGGNDLPLQSVYVTVAVVAPGGGVTLELRRGSFAGFVDADAITTDEELARDA